MREEAVSISARPRRSTATIVQATIPIVFGAVGMIFYVVAIGAILTSPIGGRVFGMSPFDVLLPAALLPALGAVPARNAFGWLALAVGAAWLGCWWWIEVRGGLAAGGSTLWLPLTVLYLAPPLAALLAITAGALRLRARDAEDDPNPDEKERSL